ncbi:hypothetical protein [Legionella worsleiensis]|uniref:SGNH/GDSL hydrolase family protein n=1 Tax=Legionella worsleiensis TaxID=45076 RepID=A0A0W1A3D3_9GAMM|nr:hypothetical protein [Legionella worsleiensis]KTD75886.1 hypothetical protein Lwor_2452 [Legionella worsleiensis]STY32899.1 Uncharacterised protein [Legionella worsleiensis]
MKEKKLYQYFIAVFSGVLLTHVLFSYIMGLVTTGFYKNTLINVRNYDGSETKPLSRSYLTNFLKKSQKPVMLIMGSSFSYGNSLSALNTYAHHLMEQFPNFLIMNASVIGESGQSYLDNLSYLKAKKISLDTLIIEINLFNFISTNSYFIDDEKFAPKDLAYDSYFDFYFLHPHGINSILNLDLNRLYTLEQTGENKYQYVALPDAYSEPYDRFKDKLPNYTLFLNSLFSSSSSVAHNVYFFISPIYKNGVAQSQFKVSDIECELNDIYKICQQFPKVHCLNPGLDYPESHFMNLSHFNEEGHRHLAKWLARQINGDEKNQLAQKEADKQNS